MSQYRWVVQMKDCPLPKFRDWARFSHDWPDARGELCVIHTSNIHGLHSYGWSDETKIILPHTNPGTRDQRRTQLRQAFAMADAFNLMGLGSSWTPAPYELNRRYYSEVRGILPCYG